MKIGVFGDSYASNVEDNSTLSWVDILGKKYDVVNYSSSGTSLFFSMQLFEEHQKKYDKIIFLVTCPGRILLDETSCINQGARSITGLRNCEYKISTLDLSKEATIVFNAVKDYFLYVQNSQFDSYVHNLMVEEIKRKRPDVILIPSFKDSFNDVAMSVRDIQEKEDGMNYVQEDRRHCHMSEINNKTFASKVEKWLAGSPVDINLDDY
jgi:hypothetical protein